MTDPNDDSDNDIALFREAVDGARPLQHDRAEPHRSAPPPRAEMRRRDDVDVLEESLNADIEAIEWRNGDGLRYRRPEIGERVLRKLARGQFRVEAELDLHGYTVREAREVLKDFLRDCRLEHWRCVRVIHGKGLGSGHRGPRIKGSVDGWLRRSDQVAAFVSARQVDGGSGALYVLLRQ
ncbi:MAG: Smr/MutS family protein [Pseudomonadota bacterium]